MTTGMTIGCVAAGVSGLACTMVDVSGEAFFSAVRRAVGRMPGLGLSGSRMESRYHDPAWMFGSASAVELLCLCRLGLLLLCRAGIWRAGRYPPRIEGPGFALLFFDSAFSHILGHSQ